MILRKNGQFESEHKIQEKKMLAMKKIAPLDVAMTFGSSRR
jgi:hypothetical protein